MNQYYKNSRKSGRIVAMLGGIIFAAILGLAIVGKFSIETGALALLIGLITEYLSIRQDEIEIRLKNMEK